MINKQTPGEHNLEKDKLAALQAFGRVDAGTESRYDQITQLVVHILGASIARVSLIDKNRNWSKSNSELAASESPIGIAFPTHCINAASGKLVVPDALDDPRFQDNPLVTGPPFIRAYAGVTLYSPGKVPLGTLSVIDQEPRQFSDKEMQTLQMFAYLIEDVLYPSEAGNVAVASILGNDAPVAMHSEDFAKAVTDILGSKHYSKMVLGKVSLKKSKSIQKTFGEDVLDECKKELSIRLRLALASRRFLLGHNAHEGFNFLCAGADSIDTIESISSDLDVNISRRFRTSKGTVHTSVAIGIVEIGPDEQDFYELRSKARVALERATLSGGSDTNISVYESSMTEQVERAQTLALRLEGAIAAKQIELHFQPKVRLSDFKVIGAEALLRWQTPDFGFVPPPEVIKAAEDAGSLLELEMYILEAAISTISRWRATGIFTGRVSVNISESTLLSENMEAELETLRLKYRLPAKSLEFEILESTLLNDVKSTVTRIEALRLQGITFSLDDFGTGYSSLSHLNHLPVDNLKIDRSFISRIVDDQRGAAMAHQIIGIGHTMNSQVVAEGVETFEQYLILRSLGCDIVQGYFFSRPIPAFAFEELLLTNSGRIPPPSGRTKNTSIDAIDIINRVALFAPLSKQDRSRLAVDAVHHLFHAGTKIVLKGSKSDAMYIVISGVVEVYRKLANGTTLNFAKLAENEIFGELSLLTGKRRSTTVRAHTECLVLEIKERSFREIMRESPVVATEMAMLVTDRRMKMQ
jgi:EAL domain-containing protein (putative c-di-GMP-specific phosphodiesterase class I)